MRMQRRLKNNHSNLHLLKFRAGKMICHKKFTLAGREFLQLSPFLNRNTSTKAISTNMWRCRISFEFQN